MDKARKREFVAWLSEIFKDSGSVVVAHYSGLTVAQMSDFRSKMRKAGGFIKVAKNRLARIALRDVKAREMASLFAGQTLIAYSSDPITAPKISVDFSKANDNFFVLGGAMGAVDLDTDGITYLASLSSLDDLRARLADLISRPAIRIVQALTEPTARVVQVIDAFSVREGNAI